MTDKTRKTALLAMGVALFVVLSLCLQVPVFENYYLCLGYVVMVVYCYSFGTFAGMATGFFGVILYCVVISGLRGMPGWALGNLVIGAALGACFKVTKPMRRPFPRAALQIAVIVTSVALGILIVKSGTEGLLYAQPFPVRAAKNSYAFVADVAVLLASLPVCVVLDGHVQKLFRKTPDSGTERQRRS